MYQQPYQMYPYMPYGNFPYPHPAPVPMPMPPPPPISPSHPMQQFDAQHPGKTVDKLKSQWNAILEKNNQYRQVYDEVNKLIERVNTLTERAVALKQAVLEIDNSIASVTDPKRRGSTLESAQKDYYKDVEILQSEFKQRFADLTNAWRQHTVNIVQEIHARKNEFMQERDRLIEKFQDVYNELNQKEQELVTQIGLLHKNNTVSVSELRKFMNGINETKSVIEKLFRTDPATGKKMAGGGSRGGSGRRRTRN